MAETREADLAETREADLAETREADLAETREADLAETREADRAERPPDPSRGWLRAMVVGGLAVDVVLVAAVVTFLLPPAVGDVVFRTPLLIAVLVAGTGAVLWTITRPRRLDR